MSRKEKPVGAEILKLLDETRDANPRVRKDAVRQLCPCKLKFDSDEVWARLFELTGDSDDGVRRIVFHNLTDGVPRHRTEEAVAAIEELAKDSHPKLRKNARKTIGRYRRTGVLDHTVKA